MVLGMNVIISNNQVPAHNWTKNNKHKEEKFTPMDRIHAAFMTLQVDYSANVT